MQLLGVLIAALIVGSMGTLVIIVIVGADRKLRRARREAERRK